MKGLLITFFAICTFCLYAQNASMSIIKQDQISPAAADESSDVWGYRHGDREYAIMGTRKTTTIIDVTRCDSIFQVGQWTDGSNTSWRDYKDYKDYIYGVCDVNCNEGLQIINKDSLTVRSQFTDVFTKCHNIFIDKDAARLYAVGTNTEFEGIHVFDLSDPGSPTLIRSFDCGTIIGNDPNQTNDNNDYYIHDIYVKNDTAYCSHGTERGLHVYDFTDIFNPVFLGQADASNGYNHSSWKHPYEPFLYVAKETHGKKVAIYNLQDLSSITFNNVIRDPLISGNNGLLVHNPYVDQNRLYMSYYHDGMKMYDVTIPDTPALVAYYDTYPDNDDYSSFEGAWGIYPFLPSGCILVNDITYGLFTLKSTLIPESRATVDVDIVINDATRGIVIIDTVGSYEKITLNNDLSINFQTITDAPTDSEFNPDNTNLIFDSSDKGVILKSPEGKYARISIDVNGDLQSTYLEIVPLNRIDINTDLYFSHYRSGLVLKDPNGDCKHITFGDAGNMEVTDMECNP